MAASPFAESSLAARNRRRRRIGWAPGALVDEGAASPTLHFSSTTVMLHGESATLKLEPTVPSDPLLGPFQTLF